MKYSFLVSQRRQRNLKQIKNSNFSHEYFTHRGYKKGRNNLIWKTVWKMKTIHDMYADLKFEYQWRLTRDSYRALARRRGLDVLGKQVKIPPQAVSHFTWQHSSAETSKIPTHSILAAHKMSRKKNSQLVSGRIKYSSRKLLGPYLVSIVKATFLSKNIQHFLDCVSASSSPRVCVKSLADSWPT